MKRRMLIVSSSLNMGGLEKCLINFCDNIDYSKYMVDLYLFNEGRTLLPLLNTNVNVLPDSPYYADVYNVSFLESLKKLAAKKKYDLFIYKISRFIRTRLHMNLNSIYDWEIMKKTMLSLSSQYDIAIGFEEGSASYYITDCIKAKKKICWVHTDIKKISSNKELDTVAFDQMDWICTVSKNSLHSLIEEYPAYENKMKCFTLPTLLNYKEITQMAEETCEFSSDIINIVSVGRLVELKGFQLCIKPLKRLLEHGYQVKWYIVGEGAYRPYLEECIEKEGMTNSFILLGNCSNPYKYIKNADICVQPSSYEGFSIAVWEEKYLKKPVIATKIPANYEMLTNNMNGYLVDRTENSIYLAVKYLLDHAELINQVGECPANCFFESQNVMHNIEKLF